MRTSPVDADANSASGHFAPDEMEWCARNSRERRTHRHIASPSFSRHPRDC
ncbi:MAG TPA: hypothetical protein VH593_29450 [Ktedonobacteraceae bacterium]